ncbi:MAG: TolC family outer membrane protein [Cocleimonas sp.]|nr:TolC family outer membrane protein [Cocleimonas sp.]
MSLTFLLKPLPRFTFSAFGCLIACSLTSSVMAENLLQVYQHAKQNDAQLKISETGYLATLEKRPQALSALKPRLDLGASSSYNLNYLNTKRSEDGNASLNFGYDLTLSKPLINKQLKAQIAQVDASILQAKANLEIDRQALIIRVAEAYFQFLNSEETLAFRKAEKGAIGRQLHQVKAYFDAGRSAITDVKEAQARYDLTNAQVVAAQQGIDVAREALKAITTRYYKKLKGVASKTPLLTPNPNSIAAWEKTAIKNSLQVMAAEQAIKVAQKTIDIERAARAPTLNLFATHKGGMAFGEDAVDRDNLDASVGVNFSMPLLEGGKISSRVREARHKLQQSRQQLELQKRLATQQTRAAYLTIVSGLSQVKALQQALNSTQTAANATQAGFEAGTRTAVDVLLSLRETFSAKRDYSSARYDFLLNTLKLKQAAGTLSEGDVAGLSKLLTK